MLRWVPGPSFGLTRKAKAAPVGSDLVPSSALGPDVVPEFIRVDDENEGIFFQLPFFDTATFNPPVAIRTYFLPSGTSVDGSVDGYIKSTLAYGEKDVTGFNGVEFEVGYPSPEAAPDGDYVIVPLYGYAV